MFNFFSLQWWRTLWRQFRLATRLIADRRVPFYAKLIPFFVLAYVLSPLDLVPSFIPGAGQADDLAIIMLGVKLMMHLTPDEVLGEYIESQNAGSAT